MRHVLWVLIGLIECWFRHNQWMLICQFARSGVYFQVWFPSLPLFGVNLCLPNVATWRDTHNYNIKIKGCTYLFKPMLKHHFPAKSKYTPDRANWHINIHWLCLNQHSIKPIKTQSTCLIVSWTRGPCTLASCYGFSYYYRFSDIAINSFNPSFIWRLEFSKNG
jgi:hypothetical protein